MNYKERYRSYYDAVVAAPMYAELVMLVNSNILHDGWAYVQNTRGPKRMQRIRALSPRLLDWREDWDCLWSWVSITRSSKWRFLSEDDKASIDTAREAERQRTILDMKRLYTKEDLDRAYQQGYAAGYRKGKDVGESDVRETAGLLGILLP